MTIKDTKKTCLRNQLCKQRLPRFKKRSHHIPPTDITRVCSANKAPHVSRLSCSQPINQSTQQSVSAAGCKRYVELCKRRASVPHVHPEAASSTRNWAVHQLYQGQEVQIQSASISVLNKRVYKSMSNHVNLCVHQYAAMIHFYVLFAILQSKSQQVLVLHCGPMPIHLCRAKAEQRSSLRIGSERSEVDCILFGNSLLISHDLP